MQEGLTLYRKALIICKLILKKEEEAMLAIELLENDILDEDDFLRDVRNFINNNKDLIEKEEILNEKVSF